MGSWKKLLWRMAADADPRGYTYDDASRVLVRLGFAEPDKPDGTHRRWRLKLPDGIVVRVGLVQKGHGTLKPGYIRDMVKALRDHGLFPEPTGGNKDAMDNRPETGKPNAPSVDDSG